MTDADGPRNGTQFGDYIFRVGTAIALGLSAISGGYTVSTTDDRYRAADAQKDLILRDIKITHLSGQLEELRKQVNRIDTNGPAVGNQGYERRLQRLEQKVDELEHGT